MADINIRNEIKAEIAKSGWTLTDIVKEMNLLHPEETTTSQNISNKLTRGTLNRNYYKKQIPINKKFPLPVH